MEKILSLNVDLGDEELNLPDYVYCLGGIVHVCPASFDYMKGYYKL